jgi:hypothetical protein
MKKTGRKSAGRAGLTKVSGGRYLQKQHFYFKGSTGKE